MYVMYEGSVCSQHTMAAPHIANIYSYIIALSTCAIAISQRLPELTNKPITYFSTPTSLFHGVIYIVVLQLKCLLIASHIAIAILEINVSYNIAHFHYIMQSYNAQ